MMKKLFETKVINIGDEAEMFQQEQMMILFGEDAPSTLADYCYNIELNEVQEDIQPGMNLLFNDHTYQITAVGDVVKKNLSDLGHITIKFDGATEAELPGTLHVEEKALPNVTIGTTIAIGS